MVELIDRNDRVTEYEYDNLYRRMAEKWLDGSQQVVKQFDYTYDVGSQMLTAGDDVADYSYLYDDLGRVTELTHEFAGLTPDVVMTHAFDLMNNRLSLAVELGGTDDFENTYTYDNLYRTTRIEQAGQTGGNTVAEKRVDLAYDIASQYSSIDRYADLAGTDLVATTNYTFDDVSRLTPDYSWPRGC